MRVWVVILVCGCGRLAFDPLGGVGIPGTGDAGDPTGDGGGDGGGGDGGPGTDGSTTLTCTDPGDGTRFSGGGFCGSWTPVITNAGLSVSSGTLQIAPNANDAGALGGCSTSSTLTASGVFAQVIQALPSTSGKTFLRMFAASGAFEISVQNGVLSALSPPAAMTNQAFDPVAEQWWRMRPVNGHVRFEVSPDAMTWTTITESVAAAPTLISIEAAATTTSAETIPGVAKLGPIDICP